MTGRDLRAKREAARFPRDLVARLSLMSTDRLAAIEREDEIEPELAARIERVIIVLRAAERRIARKLIETAHTSLREAAGVR